MVSRCGSQRLRWRDDRPLAAFGGSKGVSDTSMAAFGGSKGVNDTSMAAFGGSKGVNDTSMAADGGCPQRPGGRMNVTVRPEPS